MPFVPDSDDSGVNGRFVPDPEETKSTSREKLESKASAADYLRAVDSGLAEGVANISGGIGTFIQDPAANTLSGVVNTAHLADRGITWLMNQAGADAKVNPELQDQARLASRFAAD